MNYIRGRKIIAQLVEARLEQGISQAELARRLGIQRSGISRLESGDTESYTGHDSKDCVCVRQRCVH